jgi:hypothetical protein
MTVYFVNFMLVFVKNEGPSSINSIGFRIMEQFDTYELRDWFPLCWGSPQSHYAYHVLCFASWLMRAF